MKNKFYDINKLPTTEGIFFLGISMSRIGNEQSPKKCFDYLKHLASKIQYTDGIAMEIWYGDYLYFHSDNPAAILRDRFMEQMISHKNAFMNLLKREGVWTHKAFSFKTFGQIILENSNVYPSAHKAVLDLYKNDQTFKKYVEDDCAEAGHGLGERNVRFILEEITMFYLSQKGLLQLNNKFVTDTEKIGRSKHTRVSHLKVRCTSSKKNPLELNNPKNKYQDCFYDLEGKKLYDYTNIDLETFKAK